MGGGGAIVVAESEVKRVSSEQLRMDWAMQRTVDRQGQEDGRGMLLSQARWIDV